MLLLLSRFDTGKLLGPLLRLCGELLLPFQGRLDLSQQGCARASKFAEIVEVARNLARIVAVEQKLQGVGGALQVLVVEKSGELFPLGGQLGFERSGLGAERSQFSLQLATLFPEFLEVALQLRDRTLGIAQLVGHFRTGALCCGNFLLQAVNPVAKFAQICLLLGHLAFFHRLLRLAGPAWRRPDKRSSEQGGAEGCVRHQAQAGTPLQNRRAVWQGRAECGAGRVMPMSAEGSALG